MAETDHWHPVLLSRELGARPVAARLCGRELVVFRTERGVGALADVCPHRGMRLSEGHVEGGRLVCPYHGWRWAADGRGESPGTPTVKACAERFDAVERGGAVWVKRAGAIAAFPAVDTRGWHALDAVRRRARAPLEVVLDNFIEVEHTPLVHALLGYPLDRLGEVRCEVTATDGSVRVYNEGPQRPLPRVLEPLFQLRAGDLFVDDWTTRFSPVHTVYDQYWLDPVTRERRPNALRIAVFFVPLGADETDVVVFTWSLTPPWARFGLNALLFGLARAFVRLEVDRDVALVGRLAEKRPDLAGRSLGRFDKALVLSRRRLEALYRGAVAARAKAN